MMCCQFQQPKWISLCVANWPFSIVQATPRSFAAIHRVLAISLSAMSKACWMAFSSALWLDPPCPSIASAAGCVGLHMAAFHFCVWKELSVKRVYCFSFSGRWLYGRASSAYVTFCFDDSSLKFFCLYDSSCWLTRPLHDWSFLFELAVWSTQPACSVWQGLSLWTPSPILAGSQLAEEAVLHCQSFLRQLKLFHELLLSQLGCNRPGILYIPDCRNHGVPWVSPGAFCQKLQKRLLSFLDWPKGCCVNSLLFNLFKSCCCSGPHLIERIYNLTVIWNMHTPKNPQCLGKLVFPSCCLVRTWLLFCWLFPHPLESDNVCLAVLKATLSDDSDIVLFQVWY